MSPQLEAVIGRNITIVYDALDLQTIDRNKLRNLAVDSQPTIMDTPEMIVAVYPPNPWFVQVGDRRIRISLPIETPELGEFPLWEYAIKVNELLTPEKSVLIAYGYNFDVSVRFDENTAQKVLNNKFIKDQAQIEAELCGKLISFMPRLVFQSEDIRYDIIFEPLDDQHMKVHLNSHFESKGLNLPDSDGLKRSYMQQFERLTSTLMRFLTS